MKLLKFLRFCSKVFFADMRSLAQSHGWGHEGTHHSGLWRSWLARMAGGHEAGGSSPPSPTRFHVVCRLVVSGRHSTFEST